MTEHIGDKKLTKIGEDDLFDQSIYNRDMSLLEESDVLVAEVSTPSLGVGYEIGKAEDMNKIILCLYKNQQNKKLSAMIAGNLTIKTLRYDTLDDAISHIDNFFKSL